MKEGYPVRITRGDTGATIEVVKAEERSVLGSEFRPPLGFSAKTLQEMIGPQKLRKQ